MISGLIKEIFTAIRIQLPKIMNCPFLLQKLIDEKYTLVGEFCDGKHFTDGDNMVYWFNLSKNGKAYNPTQTLNILKTNNIRHSKFRTVYNSQSNIAELESIFTLSRTSKNEGNVLYLTDKTNNSIVFGKNKIGSSIQFSIYKTMSTKDECRRCQERFADAKDYHGLNTRAAIRITKKLFSFNCRMMNQQFPCKYRDMEADSVKAYHQDLIFVGTSFLTKQALMIIAYH